VTFDPDYVVAPGETLAEWFDDVGLPKSCARLYGIWLALEHNFRVGLAAGKHWERPA
jgi:hypothetical protein